MTEKKKTEADLLKLAREINRSHAKAVEATQTSIQYAIECGEMLIDVRDNCPYGKWEPWIAEHCPDISKETARLYMRLAKKENRAKLEKAAAETGNAVTDLSIRGAA